ncbi:MFS transporter [Actinoplanes sp. KI2]|uniref:MFS transporter n=1 Tax=Actinoplanes sp. KI2 TaxID=2983315 RepID=UPI0021D5BD6E|nr:MFS transporter [Actinoplanes sp. KI2]MCU7724822.1 MFS transporter [Actinoplanes sp. KI2]
MTPEVAPRRAWAALIVLSLAACAFVSTELLPIGLLTLIADDLHRSRSQIGLLVGGYAIVVVLTSIPLTLLTQHIPRRRLLGATLLLFAVANLAGALAGTYAVLAVARLATALTQALFWSIVAPVASGLFPVAVRGRVVGLFATGPALAPVLGVPLCTWIGQQAGWRAAFAFMAGFGVLATVAVVALIPSYRPSAGGAARGTAPDRRAFRALLTGIAIAITGFLTFTTYLTVFLLDVSGFAESALPALLLVSGLAGTAGAFVVSRTLDPHPIGTLLAALSVGVSSLTGLFLLGPRPAAAVVLVAGSGFAYAAFATSVQGRMLVVAPGSTDLASAGVSTAFNAGIAAGSLLGGALLPQLGSRPLALVGALLTAVALVTLAMNGRRRGPGQDRRAWAARTRALLLGAIDPSGR